MTVAEKFGQLEMAGPDGPNGTPGSLVSEAKNGDIGTVLDLVGVQNINAVQKAALDSRLRIPLIFGLDVIHGYKAMFPVPLGEASSWDPAMVQNDEAVSADEATADGIKWTFNPMVDISRDPRWGRVVEGAGEDPFLGSAIAAAKVRGYQGSDFSAADKMAATIKHFGADGAPVAGREYNTVDMSTEQLFNDYLPPYKAAVDAGAATVMASFNSLNGVPNTANPCLLQTILRNEWGFGSATLSDYQAVQELEDFGFANGGSEAARLALTAGINIEMAVQVGSTSKESTYANYGPQLLMDGKITMSQLNDAARPRAEAQVPGRDVLESADRPEPREHRRADHGQPGRGPHLGPEVRGPAQQCQPRAPAEHQPALRRRRRAARRQCLRPARPRRADRLRNQSGQRGHRAAGHPQRAAGRHRELRPGLWQRH